MRRMCLSVLFFLFIYQVMSGIIAAIGMGIVSVDSSDYDFICIYEKCVCVSYGVHDICEKKIYI